MAPDTLPAMAKCAGNYVNSALVIVEAKRHGYAEGLVLDIDGYVSEGSGQNIFLVSDGTLYTPPVGASILAGFTRAAVIQLARDLSIRVVEQRLPREMLYTCDEAFFTGTVAEVTPIRSVDRKLVGEGKRGPVTERLQSRFFDTGARSGPGCARLADARPRLNGNTGRWSPSRGRSGAFRRRLWRPETGHSAWLSSLGPVLALLVGPVPFRTFPSPEISP
jgi:hypothetical protein